MQLKISGQLRILKVNPTKEVIVPRAKSILLTIFNIR